MDKKDFFFNLKKIIEGEKYIIFENQYWKINRNKTLSNGNNIITWEQFYNIYDKLNNDRKNLIDKEIIKKSKTDDEKINLFIKILLKVSKKNNFYNIISTNLTPYNINKSIKYFYYYALSDININLLSMYNRIIWSDSKNYELTSILNQKNIFYDFLIETYHELKDDIIDYLQHMKIYDKLVNNLAISTQGIKTFDDYYNFRINYHNDIFQFLVGPFCWSRTEEGHDFWLEKHKNFIYFLTKRLLTPL